MSIYLIGNGERIKSINSIAPHSIATSDRAIIPTATSNAVPNCSRRGAFFAFSVGASMAMNCDKPNTTTGRQRKFGRVLER